MAPPKSEFEKQMQYLEAEIRRLEAEFNMFFAGRLPRPPWETRAKVAALVKKHDQSFIRNTADRFRFESLQNRHAKFIELWERQMTNRELGRPMRGGRVGEAPAAAPAAATPAAPGGADAPSAPNASASAGPPPDQLRREEPRAPSAPPERVVRFAQTADAQDRVKELYEQLAAAKKAAGEQPVAFDRVAALVKAQVDKFAGGGNQVDFKIGLKDGKVSLTVKPVKAEE